MTKPNDNQENKPEPALNRWLTGGPVYPEQAQPAERTREAGQTPMECGDRWEPLRSKLSLREAQYLNTYTRTGDIAALNALVLGIIAQRDDLQARVSGLEGQLAIAGQSKLDLLAACKLVLEAYEADGILLQETLEPMRAAIARATSKQGLGGSDAEGISEGRAE